MGHTLTNHHRVITRQLQPMQQQQAAAVGEMEAGRRLSRFPRLERAEVGGRYHPEDLDPTIDVDDEVCAN